MRSKHVIVRVTYDQFNLLPQAIIQSKVVCNLWLNILLDIGDKNMKNFLGFIGRKNINPTQFSQKIQGNTTFLIWLI